MKWNEMKWNEMKSWGLGQALGSIHQPGVSSPDCEMGFQPGSDFTLTFAPNHEND